MKSLLLFLFLLVSLIVNAQTYTFSLIGSRASVSISDGQIVGLSSETIVGIRSSVVYISTPERKMIFGYEQAIISGASATNNLDAVTKINTLIASASGVSSGGSSTTPVTYSTKTTSYTTTTTTGTITTGTSFITIFNNGSASGTVKGTALPVGVSITFPAVYGELNDAISYDATGTTFLIATRR